jgi:TAT-translocated FGD2 family F420-dependent dehydrogenase
MLAHEQFNVRDLTDIGAAAAQSGFGLLATSDHFQPWQTNEGHAGEAWVTLAALGGRAATAWMGTTVTCPTLRYHPAVVAQAFASLSILYPGRIFLGVGSGEALNEQAATGEWPKWEERWDRLAEAIAIIRALWSGRDVDHKGDYYSVQGRLYDPPPQTIPILTAANGEKSMRLAGLHGDGLVTDPKTWKQHRSKWQDAAREAGKNPAAMPVLIEQFVFVGDRSEAEKSASARLWRFIPKAFKTYFNDPDPASIQRRAEADLSIDETLEGWVIGSEADAHAKGIQELFDAGATIVNVHAPQADQKRVIQFYGANVLPQLSGASTRH